MIASPQLEAQIETASTRAFQALGWFCEKTDAGAGKRGGSRFGSLTPGFPDYQISKPLIGHLAVIVRLEYKRPGGSLSPSQVKYHGWMAQHGLQVRRLDSVDDALEFARECENLYRQVKRAIRELR